MVNLVEEWEALEDYAGDKQGFYQLLSDAEAVEIRVAISRLGFKKEFDNKGDMLLNRILSFCHISCTRKILALPPFYITSPNIVSDSQLTGHPSTPNTSHQKPRTIPY